MKNAVTLQVDLGLRSYPIYIGEDLLKYDNWIKTHIKSKQVAIVTNTTVAPLYLETLCKHLSAYQVQTIVLPDGEQYKTLETLGRIYDNLLSSKFSRNSTLIALGGGVIGDITGFAASTYLRGIAFIQIPTTLLAQVDSSVGGKTGVNHALGKNMIGAFYQPQCVLADTSVLNTLDDRQLSAGIAEVIKYGLIRDPEFFDWLSLNIEKLLNREPEALAYAIKQSCLNKAAVVAEDEREAGIRAILNLGHTFGHAIETCMGYGEVLHGEAVAIGTCLAAHLSHKLGRLCADDVKKVIEIFKRTNLPVLSPSSMSTAQYLSAMVLDKKNIDGAIRLILLEKIGKASLPEEVQQDILEESLDEYGR